MNWKDLSTMIEWHYLAGDQGREQELSCIEHSLLCVSDCGYDVTVAVALTSLPYEGIALFLTCELE